MKPQEYNIFVKYQAGGKWKSFAKGKIDLAKFATADRNDVVSKTLEIQLLKEARSRHNIRTGDCPPDYAAGRETASAGATAVKHARLALLQAGIELKGKSKQSYVILKLTVKCYVREKQKGTQQVWRGGPPAPCDEGSRIKCNQSPDATHSDVAPANQVMTQITELASNIRSQIGPAGARRGSPNARFVAPVCQRALPDDPLHCPLQLPRGGRGAGRLLRLLQKGLGGGREQAERQPQTRRRRAVGPG